MGKRHMGLSIFLALVSFVAVSGIIAQQPRKRGPQRPAAAPDLKLKYKMTTAGQSFGSVTMLKGARERSEMHSGSFESRS